MDIFWKPALLILAFTLVSSKIEDLGCDPGWEMNFDTCYLFNNKKLVTYTEAQAECNRLDASPIYILMPDELAWIVNVTKNKYPSSGYWTNMNRIIDNDPNGPGAAQWRWGMYEYVDTSDNTIFQWSSSPANDGRPACGGVNLQGHMYDADCNSRQGYICQIDNAIATQGGCPMGWLNTETDCFYVSNTSDAGQLMPWSQAKTWCMNLSPGAHLIVIDDVNDQNFLIGDLPYFVRSTYLFWTGLQGTGSPGGWSWINGAFFNQALFSWAVEPDNVANRENCGFLRYNGKYSDRDCSMKQNYICVKNEGEFNTDFNKGCGLWTRAGSMCYMFYDAPPSTWMDAKHTCSSLGGDLMNVYDIDLKSWLTEQMMDPDSGHWYWTALNDRETEGTYRWGDGSVLAPNVINWNQEPNSWGGTEDCGLLDPRMAAFNDAACSYQSTPICELDSVQTCPGSARGTWVSRPSDSGLGVDCYMFGQYANTSQLMTWDEASDYCKTLAVRSLDQFGTPTDKVPKLFALNTVAEMDFMKQQVPNYKGNMYDFWVGLNDKYNEGFWQWEKDTSIDMSLVVWGGWPYSGDPSAECAAVAYSGKFFVSYMVWGGEPYTGDPSADCAAVAYSGNFFTRNCSVKYPFICERATYLWGASSATTYSALSWSFTATIQLAVIYLTHGV